MRSPCLFTVALALFIVGCTINHPLPGSEGSSSGPPRIVTNRYQLFEKAFVVEAGQIKYRHFNLNNQGRVAGTFRSSTNIVVGICDEENFPLARKNDRNARYYYYSGKVPAGEIGVNLPPGSYYILFSNTYSIISTKDIITDIYLEQ
jgi:hypothetical protein